MLDGPMGTSELRRSLPEITERMLIRHLHEMVDDGTIFERCQKECLHTRVLSNLPSTSGLETQSRAY
jgi:DNA-binding HxlR family transcriptional regulator